MRSARSRDVTAHLQDTMADLEPVIADADVVFVDNSKVNADFFLSRVKPLLEEQYGAWQTEIRLAEDALTQAMLELKRKKMMKIGERTPDTSDEEKQVKKCKARLEHAEEKLETDPAQPRYIRTEPGVGYRWIAESSGTES